MSNTPLSFDIKPYKGASLNLLLDYQDDAGSAYDLSNWEATLNLYRINSTEVVENGTRTLDEPTTDRKSTFFTVAEIQALPDEMRFEILWTKRDETSEVVAVHVGSWTKQSAQRSGTVQATGTFEIGDTVQNVFTLSFGTTPLKGDTGNNGWTPVLAIVSDGDRRVQQVTDWTGGQGTKPATGQYVGVTGLEADIAKGVDIRGAQGAKGDPGNDGIDYIGYADKVTMDADTSQTTGTIALVTNDATASNNGYYRWSGSAWVKRDDFYANTLDPTDTSEAVTGKAVFDWASNENFNDPTSIDRRGQSLFKYHPDQVKAGPLGAFFVDDVITDIEIHNADRDYHYVVQQIIESSSPSSIIIRRIKKSDSSSQIILNGNLGSSDGLSYNEYSPGGFDEVIRVTVNLTGSPGFNYGTSANRSYISDKQIQYKDYAQLNELQEYADSGDRSVKNREVEVGISRTYDMICEFPSGNSDDFTTNSPMSAGGSGGVTKSVVNTLIDFPLKVSKSVQWNFTGSGSRDMRYSTSLNSFLMFGWIKKADAARLELRLLENGNTHFFIQPPDWKVGYEFTDGTVECTVEAEIDEWYFFRIYAAYTGYNFIIIQFHGEIAESTDSMVMPGLNVIINPSRKYVSPYHVYGDDTNALGGGITSKDVLIKDQKYAYGANVASFLKKLRDHRSGRFGAEEPTMVILGDSITGGVWAEEFKSYMETTYSLSSDGIQIHWYGGTTYDYMLPFIDNILIHNNPDCILLNEYEEAGANDYQFNILENLIQLIQDRTSADICIATWSMDRSEADALYSGTPLTDQTQYQEFNHFRDLARIYNCELIDFNEAIKEYILLGNNPADFYGTGPHLIADGYRNIHLPEIKKHFLDSDWQESVYSSYNGRREESIYVADRLKYDVFKTSLVTLGNDANWTIDKNKISTSTVSETLEITAKDIVGFKVLHGNNTADVDIEVNDGTGWVSPSTLTLDGRPLQYVSEIQSLTYSDAALWRYKRPFKSGQIINNILSDGEFESGQYKIKALDIGEILAVDAGAKWFEVNYDITSGIQIGEPVIGQVWVYLSTGNNGLYTVNSAVYSSGTNRTRVTVDEAIPDATADGYIFLGNGKPFITCEMRDPSTSLLGTFLMGYESLSLTDIEFPLQKNGLPNYHLNDFDWDDLPSNTVNNIYPGDEWEFYVRNNWIDNLSNANQVAKVIGMKRDDYTIRFTYNGGNIFDLYAIRLIHGK